MSTDKADVYIDEKALAQVDAKIQESQRMTKGIMSSWANPMEGVTQGPLGKITAPKPEEKLLQELPKNYVAVNGGVFFVKVPVQSIRVFRKLLPLFGDVEVRFTPEQKKLFLDALEGTPTPKVMSDAKAIFTLMESLSK